MPSAERTAGSAENVRAAGASVSAAHVGGGVGVVERRGGAVDARQLAPTSRPGSGAAHVRAAPVARARR